MKKLIAAFSALILFTVFAVCVLMTPNNILYFLNWGEYIDHDLIVQFQEEYHCQVIEENVTSSEAMYQKISANTTQYDVAVPGDYTVHQLYKEGKLRRIEVENDDYPYLRNYQTMFNTSLSKIRDTYMVDEEHKTFDEYYMPYFWGAYSLLFNTKKDDVEKAILQNGFKALYDRSLYQEDVRIGMYSTARWIVASYLLSKNEDPNITATSGEMTDDLSDELRDEIISALKVVKFDEFGDDSLKRDVANGSLDLCFTQSGDFFDTLYLLYSQGKTDVSDFKIDVPETTACFFDSMVIPNTCQNEKLANAFIDFMMNPDHAYQNARTVGYSPTLKGVDELFEQNAEKGEMYYDDGTVQVSLKDFLKQHPVYLNPLYKSENVYLLQPKSNDYLTTCETIFNNLA